MLQAIDLRLRQLADVFDLPERHVAFQDGEDLVVGLVVVEHVEPADGTGLEEDVAAGEGVLGQDADVQGIAVALDRLPPRARPRQGRHPVAAVGLRQEAVEGRADVRELLRAVDLEQAGRLVDLELDGVRGDDLDVGGDHRRRVGTDRHPMPRVRPEEEMEEIPGAVAGGVGHGWHSTAGAQVALSGREIST